MEDVLEVYARPHDPKRPLVCLDEFCKQLLPDTREPVAAQPGQLERTDYEYERRGMCSAFMAYSPLLHWRGVRVSGRHTAQDWAHTIQWLCDEIYPQAERIVLVQDNLNTHTPASLYEAFEPQGHCGSRSASSGIIASRRLTALTATRQPAAGYLVPRFAQARELAEHGGD